MNKSVNHDIEATKSMISIFVANKKLPLIVAERILYFLLVASASWMWPIASVKKILGYRINTGDAVNDIFRRVWEIFCAQENNRQVNGGASEGELILLYFYLIITLYDCFFIRNTWLLFWKLEIIRKKVDERIRKISIHTHVFRHPKESKIFQIFTCLDTRWIFDNKLHITSCGNVYRSSQTCFCYISRNERAASESHQ